MRFLLTVLALSLFTSVAAAQSTFTLDQATGRTGGQLNLSIVDYEGDRYVRHAQILLELGTRLSNGNRAGGYLSASTSTAVAGDQSRSGATPIELGGTYVFVNPNSSITARVGLATPGGGRFGSIISVLGLPARLTDVSLTGMGNRDNTPVLRLGVSPRGRSGDWFYQADVGIDLAPWGDDAPPAVGRLNLMGGIDLGGWALQAETSNVINLELLDELTDAALHTATVGATFEAGNFTPGVGVTMPLDEMFRDENVYVVQATVRGTLP